MKVKVKCLLNLRGDVVGVEINQRRFRSYYEEGSCEVVFFPGEAQQVEYHESCPIEATVEFCTGAKPIIVPHPIRSYHTEVLSDYVRLLGSAKALKKRREKQREVPMLEGLKQLRDKFYKFTGL